MRNFGLNGEAQRMFREVQAHFRLPSIGLVERDLHVIRAIAALAAIEAKLRMPGS